MNAARWVLLLLALAAAGCSDDDHVELLKARAARQEAEWLAMERQDQIEAVESRYHDLMVEFAEYQAKAVSDAAEACKKRTK
jgi:hypothetical protein